MKEFPFDPYDFFGYIASGLLLIVGLEFTLGIPKVTGQDLKTFDLIILTLAAYIIGQAVATPAKWVLEDIIVLRILKTPSEILMRPSSEKSLFRFIFPGYYRSLPTAIQQTIMEKVKNEGLTETIGETLFLHIRFRDYIRTDSVLMTRLQTFLNKYGFNRNISFVSLLFGAAVITINDFAISTTESKYALVALIFGLLLFFRYIKFYRQYSYELFNSYAGRSQDIQSKNS